MDQQSPRLPEAIEQFLAGDESAGDAICSALQSPIRAAVHRMLTPTDPDADDIIQDSLVAVLGYLRKTNKAPDNMEAFASTIARNRCVNLLHWRRRRRALDVDDLADQLPSSATSPLDWLDKKETHELLASVLRQLDEPCRALLEAIYRAERTIESLRAELGLKSVQAVYYRKDACIRKAQKVLNQALLTGLRVGRGDERQQPEYTDG